MIDNRKEFANKKRFPHVDKIFLGASHTAKISKLTISQNTFIMIVTQGNELDYECLKAVIGSKAGYIGVISSKAKRIKFFARLKKDGVPEELFDKINIPAGLDIGAQTPEEIAVSIMAEVIKCKNPHWLGTDKFKAKYESMLSEISL